MLISVQVRGAPGSICSDPKTIQVEFVMMKLLSACAQHPGLLGLPKAAPAVFYPCPAAPVGTRSLALETIWDLPSLTAGAAGHHRRDGAPRHAAGGPGDGLSGGATVAQIRPFATFDFNAGTHDVIVRIALPQVELGIFATMPILPAIGTPAVATRPVDGGSDRASAARRGR